MTVYTIVAGSHLLALSPGMRCLITPCIFFFGGGGGGGGVAGNFKIMLKLLQGG